METIGYCVRVQAQEGYGDKIAAMPMNSDYVALLSVKHIGSTKENPHYHIVVKTNVQPQAFRVRMKKLFPDGKGNGHMSIVPWDGDDKALSYLFHEEPDVVPHSRKGITDEYIEKLRLLNRDVQVQVALAKGKASHTLQEDAYLHFSKNKLPADSVAIGKFMILHALRSGKYVPQPWLVRAMTYSVIFRLFEGDLQREERYAESLAESIFSR